MSTNYFHLFVDSCFTLWQSALVNVISHKQSDPANTGCNSQKKIFKGTIARPTFTCVHPETGERGSWLFVGDSHKEIGASVSPVLPDYYELVQWTRANGWQTDGDAYVYQG